MAARRPSRPKAATGSSELELIRTILGEEVPANVLLSCLHAAANDVSTAVNLYFAQVTPTETIDPAKSIRSSMPLTIHPFDAPGMLSTLNGSATLTTGAVDAITTLNERFRVLRFRKRGNPGTDVLLRNGDIVSIECNGLWLSARKSNALQWKPASDSDDRSKFVVRGLGLGAVMTVGEPFFLTSYRWKDREICIRHVQSIGLSLNLPWNKPLGTSANETAEPLNNVHRCFLGLTRPTDGHWRLYFRAALTSKAALAIAKATAIPQPLNIRVNKARRPPRLSRVTEDDDDAASLFGSGRLSTTPDELAQREAKLDQMQTVVGHQSTRDQLQPYLDGAGGNVQIALEHYFMNVTERRRTRPDSRMLLAMPSDPIQRVGTTSAPTASVPMAPTSHAPPVQTAATAHQGTVRWSAVGVSGPPPPPVLSHKSLTIEDFEMLQVLGRGSFGAVMMVRYKQDGRIFAIKILKKSTMDTVDMQNAMEERQILQRLHHPYVSSLIFAFQTNERLYLGVLILSIELMQRWTGMKYYAAGDLFYHLNQKGGGLDALSARLYAAELVLAISYLHSLNILYRDLKPSNVMIDDEGHIGVVDFGLSKQHIYGANHGVKTLSGTAEYVAPEALVQTADGSRDYGKSYDWWSFGIVFYEMLVGVSPFYHENERLMLQRIVSEDVRFPPDFPKDAKSLVEGLLNRDPKARFGVDAIKAHPYFREVNWTKLAQRQVPAFWKPNLSSETDTRYVDPEFTREGPPSAVYDPKNTKTKWSKRFSQFSFDFKNQT
ncbi:protein kinase [Achlya hypogyna]|uniref:Protein kinase n=1 Tax=Achlya hypogyna TaxID=1202772 RepID=A0A1V9YEH5_ACHHY|nr:protein kinase [Achlya hypogyna]